ncbi:class I SAM-dependent methyltransferase [Candidatus Omnitrophota bacterium]
MESKVKIFLKLVTKFDLATSLFRSFELISIKQVLKGLKIENPILDIGCAEGNIADEVFKNNRVFGLDNELGYLSIAKKKGLYTSLVAADARNMPFRDNTFGFLFSNSVLEHIIDLDCVLDESKRILKPGGVFLFTAPNNNFAFCLFFYQLLKLLGFKSLALKYTKERNKRLNHFHLYSQETWADLINKHGFRVISMKEYISRNTLMLWDLIAAIQFFLKTIFSVFIKLPIVKNILLTVAYMLRIIFAFILFPIFLLLKNITANGCATLIVVTKNQ